MGIVQGNSEQKTPVQMVPDATKKSWQNEWHPHRRRPTEPRSATSIRIKQQGVIGWPSTSKLVILGNQFIHPTKGFRVYSPGRDTEVKKEHRLEKPRKHPRSKMADLIESMTNWQRHQFAKAKAKMRNLDVEAEMALALSCSELVK